METVVNKKNNGIWIKGTEAWPNRKGSFIIRYYQHKQVDSYYLSEVTDHAKKAWDAIADKFEWWYEPMNKLTNEEKANVFAMYWNQKVYGDLQDDNEQCNYGVVDIDYDNFEFCVNENMKLLLTPLDKITDEHAIEVAKMVYPQDSVLHIAARGKDMAICIFEKGTYTVNSWVLIQIVQYLISKGYAVPLWFGIDHWANGKTAIELGIAIENTLNS